MGMHGIEVLHVADRRGEPHDDAPALELRFDKVPITRYCDEFKTAEPLAQFISGDANALNIEADCADADSISRSGWGPSRDAIHLSVECWSGSGKSRCALFDRFGELAASNGDFAGWNRQTTWRRARPYLVARSIRRAAVVRHANVSSLARFPALKNS